MQKSIFTTDYHITVKEGLKKLKLSRYVDGFKQHVLHPLMRR